VKSQSSGFLDRIASLGGREYRYPLCVPPGYTEKTSWPLILFLHGSGERGEDGDLPTQVGLGAAIRRHEGLFPAVAVFPQLPAGENWRTAAMQRLALLALECTTKEFRVDPRRLYLTGISLGGTGVWALAAAHPGLFAALAPVCGRCPWAADTEIPQDLGNIPAWIFHGAEDPVVPVENSRRMAHALQGGGAARYTEYPGEGHAIWDRAYGGEEFCTWLFAQRRKPP